MPAPSHPRFDTLTRRAAIQAGTIGLLGLGLNHLLAAPPQKRVRAKSVIYIFLSGGLSQHESFDPKPDAPMEVRGDFKPIRTRTPGLHICEHLPELAKRSQKWAVCRSLTHPSNDHSLGHHIMLTGRSEMPKGFSPVKPQPSDWPSIASLATTILTSKNALPSAIVLPDKIVHRTGRTVPGQFGGMLGVAHDPWFLDASPYHPEHYGAYPDYLFHHHMGPKTEPALAFHAPNLHLPKWLANGRLADRITLQRTLDSQRTALEASAEVKAHDRNWEMAVSLMTDPKVAQAFDFSRAPAKVQDAYGRNSFGQSLLMAAQLVENGVRLVQVNLGNNETWDTHESLFPNMKDFLLPPMDRAVSALLDDLEARGLLDSTLVVMASEFGRTPKISKLPSASLPGRDHWGAVQSIFLAGGGVRGGAVLGSSDKIGGHPASDARSPEDFAATIYHALGIPHETQWQDMQGRPYNLYEGKPLELFA